MNKKMDDYCRKNREKSISPSISLEISQYSHLSPEEKREKEYYGATIVEMTKELFSCFDDLLRNVNFFLQKNIKIVIKSVPESQLDEILYDFFECNFASVTQAFDNGELLSQRILNLNEMNKETSHYLVKRSKRKSLLPIVSERESLDLNSSNFFSPLKKFDFEKNKMGKLLRENLQLRIEIAMEKRIQNNIKENKFDSLKDKFTFLEDEMRKKPDLNYVEKNLDIMSNKLKMMKREIKQLNINY